MGEKYKKIWEEIICSPLCSLLLHLQMEQNSWLTQDDCLTPSLRFSWSKDSSENIVQGTSDSCGWCGLDWGSTRGAALGLSSKSMKHLLEQREWSYWLTISSCGMRPQRDSISWRTRSAIILLSSSWLSPIRPSAQSFTSIITCKCPTVKVLHYFHSYEERAGYNSFQIYWKLMDISSLILVKGRMWGWWSWWRRGTSLPSLPTTASKEQMARPPKISETFISIRIYSIHTSLQMKTQNHVCSWFLHISFQDTLNL